MPNARNPHNNLPGSTAPARRTGAATLVARGVTKYHGEQAVLDTVGLSVGNETRLGVLGPNGVGKTTLLRILAGLEEPDKGRVTLLSQATTVGYLRQEREAVEGETLAEYLAGRTGIAQAQAALDQAAGALAAAEQGADIRYSAALERYLALGGPDFEARAEAVCADLALPVSLLALGMSQLSGGQVARAALGALLLSRFDVVLLDEPTNDLDFDGLERLENFLDRRDGGLVVVSHDRAFLERVVTSVAEIDAGSHRLTVYRGGWEAYLEARTTAQRHAEEAHIAYSIERERLLARARRQRQWAVAGVSKATKGPRDNDKATEGLPAESYGETGLQGPLERTGPRPAHRGGKAIRILATPPRNGGRATQRRHRGATRRSACPARRLASRPDRPRGPMGRPVRDPRAQRSGQDDDALDDPRDGAARRRCAVDRP